MHLSALPFAVQRRTLPGAQSAPEPETRRLQAAPATADDDIRQLLLVPNCALTPRGALQFFLPLAALSLGIAGFCAWHGLWPVLPFAGLELALLAWALGDNLRRGRWSQQITITSARLRIDTRLDGQPVTVEFPRPWARVTLCTSRSWHPSRLLIESSGRACEIGAFLTEEERLALHARLRLLVAGNHGS